MAEEPIDEGMVRMGRRREGGSRRRDWRSRSGDVEEGLPPLRPRGVGELLDLAIEVFVRRFWLITACSVAVWFPLRALQPFFGLHTVLNDPEAGFAGFVAPMAVSWAAPLLAQMLITSMVAIFVYASLQGFQVRTAAVMLYTLKRLFALAVLLLIVFVVVSAGYVACFVPGILLSWKFFAAAPALILEGTGIGNAISRSFYLTKGSFWRWAGVKVVLWFLVVPFSFVTLADNPDLRPGLMDTLGLSPGLFDLLLVLFSSFFMGVATAAAAVLAAVFYLDCRVRVEGHDLRMRLERFGREVGAEDPGLGAVWGR